MFSTKVRNFSSKLKEVANNGFHSSENLPPQVLELRKRLTGVRDGWNRKLSLKCFAFDAYMAATLYDEIGEFGLTADTNFWRQFNLVAIPDIISARWDISLDNYSEKKNLLRFLGPRRNYSGSLWWFVHLTRLNDKEFSQQEWIDSVKNATTDSIVALVERAGKDGYPVDLYRKISEVVFKDDRDVTDRLRKIMVLNTARQMTTYPEACENGLQGYVEWLMYAIQPKSK